MLLLFVLGCYRKRCKIFSNVKGSKWLTRTCQGKADDRNRDSSAKLISNSTPRTGSTDGLMLDSPPTMLSTNCNKQTNKKLQALTFVTKKTLPWWCLSWSHELLLHPPFFITMWQTQLQARLRSPSLRLLYYKMQRIRRKSWHCSERKEQKGFVPFTS